MDNECQYTWYSEVQMNNAPPTQADMAGARLLEAYSRMPHSLPPERQYSSLPNDGSIISWQYSDSPSPTGTRAFNQRPFQPFNASSYLQGQLTGGQLGDQVYPSHPILQLPELHGEPESTQRYHALNGDFFDTTPMTENQSCTGMNFGNMFSHMSYPYSAEFIAQDQQVSRDETMMVPEFIPSRDSILASRQDDIMHDKQYHMWEKPEEVFDLPNMFGTTFSFEQVTQLEREHAYLSPNNPGYDLRPRELFIQSTSETETSSSKRKRENMGCEDERYCIAEPKNSKGHFGLLDFSLESRACTSDRQDLAGISRNKTKTRRTTTACSRCRRIKLVCHATNEACDPCSVIGCRCIKEGDPAPSFTSPDLIMDHKIGVTQPIDFKLLVSDPMTALVFMSSDPYAPIIPLSCKVRKHKASSKTSRDLIVNSRIWEDVQLTLKRTTTFQPDRLWSDRKEKYNSSYSIPEPYMPSHDTIQGWALETLDYNPQGAIGEFHGELWIASTQYLQPGTRPFHELVSLTRKYAAIYNVCNSELSLLLYSTTRPVCPWLRAQICVPVLTATGVELNLCLKDAVYRCREQSKETQQAMCIALWFLMLIYQHSDDQARKRAFLSMEPNTISPEDLSTVRQQLEESLLFIRDVYENWFKRKAGMVFPNPEDKGKQRQKASSQDIQLQIAVANLHIATRHYHQDFQRADGSVGSILRSLIDPNQEVKGLDVAPEVDDLDFDKCSIVAEAQSGEGNALLRDHETAEEREDYMGPEISQAFDLTADDRFEPYDWDFEKSSTEVVDYKRDGGFLLQELENLIKQPVTPKGKQADVDTDSDMTDH